MFPAGGLGYILQLAFRLFYFFVKAWRFKMLFFFSLMHSSQANANYRFPVKEQRIKMKLEAEQYQKLLFPYAYNILGSADEAKDVVGEVLAKHIAAQSAESIHNEKAYLTRSVINLAITTKKRQRRVLREGEAWLPEPVATDEAADYNLNLTDILSYSLLVLLERLSAMERSVFILRESFDYTHEEIGACLSVTAEYSRQLLKRAKSKLYKPELRKQVHSERQKDTLEHFIKAIRERDMERLEQLMASDIEFYVDGGGKVPFVSGHCRGAHEVARVQITVYERYLQKAEWVYTTVNHQPALLSFVSGQLKSCQVFDVHPQKDILLSIHAVLDPQKLRSFISKK